MTIEQILLIGAVSLLFGWLLPIRWRVSALVGLSIMVLFWLQPDSPLDGSNWLFPLLSLLMVLGTWLIVRVDQDQTNWRGLMTVMVLAIGAGMLINPPQNLPPVVEMVTVAVMGVGALTGMIHLVQVDTTSRQKIAVMLVAIIALTLLIYKTPPVMDFLNQAVRSRAGLSVLYASPIDWQWIGISYLSFRLMAVLLDYRAGRLPPLSFEILLVYAIFPPALPAGPIERVERFAVDLAAGHRLDAERLLRGGRRLFSGLFRKFVIADSLALIALSPAMADDVNSVISAWIVAYLYAFQIFFDFSGYTEIAIGLGVWLGVDLPENFNRPYLQRNLAQFWQNWHMTLTGWFRSYFFLPVTRLLLRRKLPISEYFMVQLATMILIGLWHGVMGHFVLWGIWHAVGLYLHHLLARYTRRWYLRIKQRPWLNRISYGLSVLATFHWVVIGWVFFVLPEPFVFIGKLFGLGL